MTELLSLTLSKGMMSELSLVSILIAAFTAVNLFDADPSSSSESPTTIAVYHDQPPSTPNMSLSIMVMVGPVNVTSTAPNNSSIRASLRNDADVNGCSSLNSTNSVNGSRILSKGDLCSEYFFMTLIMTTKTNNNI